MGRLIKVILSIIAIVIALIIAAVIILPLVIDPNDFKPEIQAAVKKKTGRDLNIDGDLKLSVFPWVGFTTGKLTLSNAAGFSDKVFAEIIESDIKVKLMPLFSKELDVNRVVLKGLVLNLAKNKQGLSNWDDLINKEAATAQTEPTKEKTVSPLAALAINGLSIENANVSWDDQQQGKHFQVNDFNLTTGRLAFDQAIDIDLSLIATDKKSNFSESMVLSTKLQVNEQFDIFKLEAFSLNSTTKGSGIPGGSLKANLLAEIAVDLTQQTLKIANLKLDSSGLKLSADVTGTNIKDNPVFVSPIKITEFNLAKVLKNMSITLPEMQDASALSKLSANFNVRATTDSADISNILIKLDDSTIDGSSSIRHFSKPAIKFNLNIDSIDVDRYLAPQNPESEKKIASPASAAAASAGLFPVETLRELNANGQLNIGSLKVNQLKMQGLSLKVNAKNGVIKTGQTIKQLYQGAYKGNTTINVKSRSPSVALNEHLTKVNVQSLLTAMTGESRITGTVNANINVQGYGNSVAAIKSSLGGKLDFNFNDGVIKGFNIQKVIDNSKALIKGTALPTENKSDQTVFSSIRGTANITKGLIHNDDLSLKSSKVHIDGKGTASLVTDKLDYQVIAKLLKSGPEKKIKGMPLIVNIGGTMAKPSYQIDIAAMVLEKNRAKITKELEKNRAKIEGKIEEKAGELLKKLDDKIAPGVGDLIKDFF